jgi:hypothetical protein
MAERAEPGRTRVRVLERARAARTPLFLYRNCRVDVSCPPSLISRPITALGPSSVVYIAEDIQNASFIRGDSYPDDNTLAYYRSKGFKTVRVTFLWERQAAEANKSSDDKLVYLNELDVVVSFR